MSGLSQRLAWRGPVAGLAGGAVVFLAYYGAGYPVPKAVLFGLGAFAGAHLAFGADFITVPVFRPPAGWDLEDFQKLIADARGKIARIETANLQIPSEGPTRLMTELTRKAAEIVDLVEADPAKVREGQKFLSVYLKGIARISENYARTHSAAECEELDGKFLDLLEKALETSTEMKQILIASDRLDLDVDISVLTKRLNFEGL
ncbi:5-bromo-4-chloroindolyl phosphate hydrolysis family protein [Labrenzia sp. VG12]|uniref:5-bromo-4-chloroindolyl phosphate hydrolysis family protein n=1 Tax=Labrenzia sp. VG12 TaxID=2021862 RepID=UPI000B8C1722|nr:5-bromo-4-chloroindolyl phosphate hydrolysis family protein [Labrenzia sp. VG12]ASP35085.1 hypothetical protein CHH27_19095 [Labrenzia sp. VG12]